MLYHFIEEGFRSHIDRLGDREYSRVLNSIVITCVDVILLNTKGEMLLGKRSYHPAKTWWIAGGRMRPGESFEEAAVRNIKRELGLIIAPERFSYLGTYSFVWAIRRQPPVENGSHCVSITMTLKVTDEEAALIKPSEEYTETRWWDLKLVAEDLQFLSPIRQYAREILAQR
jgi:ADP-ribose pyrophosphatase YjhB (NUDIX family)